ncbi:putative 2-hydroxyacid dehydrogenase [Clostridium homopropionicum DSM 5847]|uniref:Putative 2-hydroxyacid dehydrogenase n=1 Tax=Clostridium homopropionicum DSM 5847 TaxID=1121318 RepID=A0A0L6Z6L8_9CLOT|nr:D-2-hydroxyacid dehydrogenase [Clostridium homopropionicum]KOA18605.1 putative 2-hydroxyacid dehydrogenase [Clostridium homopropionicum DSM 5847]SFG49798.1 glycerate dehydrogenase [Clostridium homopropionicum]
MKIVVLDGYTLNPGDISWEDLEKLGELKVYDRTEKDKVIERIGDAEIIFTNKVQITKEILKKTNIKYIGVLATGYNVVDISAAKEKGISVTNIPTYGTDTVAQMVFAHILNICHHVSEHNTAIKEGQWTNNLDFCFWNYPQIELVGKTIGIIGYGRIGRATGRIAEVFGMKVLAYANHENKEFESETMKYTSLDELLQKSDIISLHCPLFENTKGIINKNTIAKMKDGVIIINTSRGPLINEEDLAEAIISGKVYAAGIDVVSTEPIKEDNPLLKCKNAFITPHIAWASKEARQRLMNIAVNNLIAFLKGEPVNLV